jgi:hypothetical protein
MVIERKKKQKGKMTNGQQSCNQRNEMNRIEERTTRKDRETRQFGRKCLRHFANFRLLTRVSLRLCSDREVKRRRPNPKTLHLIAFHCRSSMPRSSNFHSYKQMSKGSAVSSSPYCCRKWPPIFPARGDTRFQVVRASRWYAGSD